MTKTGYIGIGSNLGDKLNNCLKAIDLIDRTPGCSVEARSRFFRTEPVGVEGQDWYINCAISLSTRLSAQDLLKVLQAVEAGMGRERKDKWASRTIDLDILFFGESVIDRKALRVPHPLMHLRRFVLVPMAQLAPDLRHPVLGKTMVELLDLLAGERQAVICLEEV
ncbi:MAG: 2-amino-4-hydroxy-6-hydroxymethyldihydropteridine diphosphokinase [Thermodesulfobacteriota bacterium]|nr:2-amino-4-hydroxy-6-hydroxymethyldihydropteridine diphosphokinase [Thermodesulfobacteriota bacterium]